jgi:hypothetical protein
MGQQYSRHGIRRATGAVALAASATLLAACGGGSSNDSSSDSTGTASFSVTDAPVDKVNRVQITFDRIDLKPAEGEIQTIELEKPRTIENLLALQGNNSEQILPDTTLPAGQYNWIRLFVIGGYPDSVVYEEMAGDAPLDLFVPGQQGNADRKNRFVQLSSPFRVPAGGSADFTIDIQLRKALTKPAKKNYYLLRPSLRLIDNSESGTLVGEVDRNFQVASGISVNDGCGGPSIYVYETDDGDFTAGDIDSENEPLTTADLKAPATGADSSNYTYEVGFLAAADYRVAVACADGDDPEAGGDEIPISATKRVTVTAGDDLTVLDFGL